MLYKEKTVSFVTGAPGTGKSSIMETIASLSRQSGRKPRKINDYVYLTNLAQRNRHNPRLVTWHEDGKGGEYFLVEPTAYPEASTLVAATIARNLWWWLLWSDDLIIEFARGAGVDGSRDQYDQHGFDILYPKAKKLAKVANMEVVVHDTDLVHQRMNARLELDPTAAPAFVHDKYLDHNGNQLSSVMQAVKYSFVVNEQIDNGGRPDETEILVASLFQRLVSTPSVR